MLKKILLFFFFLLYTVEYSNASIKNKIIKINLMEIIMKLQSTICANPPTKTSVQQMNRYALKMKYKSRDMNRRNSCACSMCGNPRKWFGDKSLQEVRMAA